MSFHDLPLLALPVFFAFSIALVVSAALLNIGFVDVSLHRKLAR